MVDSPGCDLKAAALQFLPCPELNSVECLD